ncbi:MAG: hypothetical protein ACOX45_08865 [Acutalibacteraceae bacterium]
MNALKSFLKSRLMFFLVIADTASMVLCVAVAYLLKFESFSGLLGEYGGEIYFLSPC